MKRYYYIAVIAAAALLIGGIGAGVFLLSKRPENCFLTVKEDKTSLILLENSELPGGFQNPGASGHCLKFLRIHPANFQQQDAVD